MSVIRYFGKQIFSTQRGGSYKRISDKDQDEIKKQTGLNIGKKFHLNQSRTIQKGLAIPLLLQRDQILSKGLEFLISTNSTELTCGISVEFIGEDAKDTGGVTKEFLTIFSRGIFDETLNLFESLESGNGCKFVIRERVSNGLKMIYQSVGRLMGIGILNQVSLDLSLPRIFYKMIKRECLTLDDLACYDEQMYKSLKWIQDNDPKELNLTFSIDEIFFEIGRVECDLVLDGGNIRVDNVNKDKFIELMIDWISYKRTKVQIDAMIRGLFDIIPRKILNNFSSKDLQVLVEGEGGIDICDWEKWTVYEGGRGRDEKVVKWLWTALREDFDRDEREKLLMFVTSCRKTPVGGFKALKFTIKIIVSSDCMLPFSHTWYMTFHFIDW